MALLFEPLTQRAVTFRNRIAVAPMCMYSAVDGVANDWHLVHLGARAAGGAGLVIAEATAVTPDGRISPEDLGLWSDDQVEPLRRITQFIQGQGARAGLQLAHAGRKASTRAPARGSGGLPAGEGGWTSVAPSATAFPGLAMPRALAREELPGIVAAFAAAARRAAVAGFDLVELHAAHGYLLHQFLSPLANQRTDDYGGAFANRIRLVLEVTAAVRAAWPAGRPLWVRLSVTDYAEGGWTADDSVLLARELRALGVDLVDCSSGGMLPDVVVPVGPGYQVAFAERLRREAGIATGAVGLITAAAQAEQVLRTGQADVVLLARELLRDPHWPLHAATALGHPVDCWPVQYRRAAPALPR